MSWFQCKTVYCLYKLYEKIDENDYKGAKKYKNILKTFLNSILVFT